MDPPSALAVLPQATAISTGSTFRFTAATSDPAGVNWSATAGTIAANGDYSAPSGAQSTTVTVTATNKTDPSQSATATVHVVAPGQVSATANPQVALYSIAPGAPGSVRVEFTTGSEAPRSTWALAAPPGGGTVDLLVAGMKLSTAYQLTGVVQFADGTEFMDARHTFVTGPPAGQPPAITASTTAGMMPQSGVELLDLIDITSAAAPLEVTDLSGNVLWSYSPGLAGVVPDPIKLLPNGHFLINFSANFADGANSVLQEVDLTGAVVWQMTAADLNAALAAATCAGCNLTVVGTHHDFAVLPNGHLIVIAAVLKNISGITYTGDVLIDLDQNHKPVWLWNEFDHLDVNRHPFDFPDWTHTNAILYSPDDGNLIVSIRHQNWVIKVDYENGAGTGDILWKLGYQGDFALTGGTDPTDWFYAQHGPSFTTTNTTGKFSLALFDNGNDRVFPTGVTCGAAGEPPCFYSSVPILQLDENAKTATLTFHPMAPTFSNFGGNAELLKNGDVEFCEAAGGPGLDGDIYEVTPGDQTVWTMQIAGQFAYRGMRLPSLYPGVQW